MPVCMRYAAGANNTTSQRCMAFKGFNRGSQIGHGENLGDWLQNMSRLQTVRHTKGSLRYSDQLSAACCD